MTNTLATFEMEYGTLHVVGFGDRRRNEVYVSKEDGSRHHETSFATGPKDFSPRQNHSIGHGYDSKCSCCYLNFSHTEEYHRQSIGTGKR